MKIDEAGWREYVDDLAVVTDTDTSDLEGFLIVLEVSHKHIEKPRLWGERPRPTRGCFEPRQRAQSGRHLPMSVHGKTLTSDDVTEFKAYILKRMAN